MNSLYSTPVRCDYSYSFYTSIEDAYSYANRTLLKLLLSDQQLIPRLRSLKHYFFLSQSFFLTHFLDIASQELRKPVKAASSQKLQTLLSVALNTDGVMFPQDEAGTNGMHRDDVRMALQSSGLYDWLLKVASVKGALVGDEDNKGMEVGNDEGNERKKDKGKDKDKDKDKKILSGEITHFASRFVRLMPSTQRSMSSLWTIPSSFHSH